MKTFKELYDVIENANLEFNKNGRTDIFSNYEQEIIAENNPAYIYFFARYVRGADVKKLQSILLTQKNCLKYGFYFCLYVEGAEVIPFLEKAVAEKNAFWIKIFYSLVKDRSIPLDDDFEKEIERVCPRINQKSEYYSIDLLISIAQKEFEKNGRSKKFVELERQAIYSIGAGNIILFAQKNNGMDLDKFVNALILRGNITNIAWAVDKIKGIDKKMLYDWSALTKFDYQQINKDAKKKELRRLSLVKELEDVSKTDDKAKIRKALVNLKEFINEWSYVDTVRVSREGIKQNIEQSSIYNFSYDDENNSTFNVRFKKIL